MVHFIRRAANRVGEAVRSTALGAVRTVRRIRDIDRGIETAKPFVRAAWPLWDRMGIGHQVDRALDNHDRLREALLR